LVILSKAFVILSKALVILSKVFVILSICHPERSEGSIKPLKILRFAQDDKYSE
jgi:hypothetical protein